MRARLSRAWREADVLEVMADGEARTVAAVARALEGKYGWEVGTSPITGEPTRFGDSGSESLKTHARAALESLVMQGKLVREPTGRGRPRWVYRKPPSAEMSGPIAELERQFTTEGDLPA